MDYHRFELRTRGNRPIAEFKWHSVPRVGERVFIRGGDPNGYEIIKVHHLVDIRRIFLFTDNNDDTAPVPAKLPRRGRSMSARREADHSEEKGRTVL